MTEPEHPESDNRDFKRAFWFGLGTVLLVGVFIAVIVLATGGDDDDEVAAEDTETTTTQPEETTTTVETTTTTVADGNNDNPDDNNDDPPETAAPQTAAPGPTVDSMSAQETFTCEQGPDFEGGSTTLTVSWTTSNAESVTIAIDNPDGPYETGLPPDGSLDVPAPCAPDTNTYYVIAIGADGSEDRESRTTTGLT